MRSEREGDHRVLPIREAEPFMPRKPLDGMQRRAMVPGVTRAEGRQGGDGEGAVVGRGR
jgi:hypothetical protein